MSQGRSFALALLISFAVISGANAATRDWTGLGDGSTWSDSLNWSLNVAPVAGDDVTILTGSPTVTMNVSISLNSLQLGGTTGLQTLVIPASSTLTLTGAATSSVSANGSLELNGGTLEVNGSDLAVSGVFTWLEGTLKGSKKTVVNSYLDISGSGAKALDGHALHLSGVATWSGLGNMTLANSAMLNVLAGGSFSIENSQNILSSGSPSSINVDGTLSKVVSPGTTAVDAGITVTVAEAGMLIIEAAKTLHIRTLTNFAANALTNGQYLLQGTLKLGGGGGTLTSLDAMVQLDTGAGIVDGAGADLLPGLNTLNGTLTLLNGRALTVSGALSITGYAWIGSGCTLSSAAGSELTINGGSVYLSGQLSAPGARVNIASGSLYPEGGTVGDLTNSGIVGLQSGFSLFTVTGNYTQTSAGRLYMAATGPLASQCSRIDITGSAQLAGKLSLNFSLFTPALGQSFQLLTYASATGGFAVVETLIAPPAGTGLAHSLGATSFIATIALPATPTITEVSVSPNPAKVNDALTFSAAAVPGGAGTLTFTWDFGDATALGVGSPVTHTFTTEGVYTVTMTVTDGTAPVQTQVPVTILGPNSGGSGVSNIAAGAPAIAKVSNPLDGLSIEVISSNGGLIELYIDVNSLIRAAYSVSTDFNGLQGRVATATGVRAVHKFSERGINVAVSTATETATGLAQGKARKMLVISDREIGQSALLDNRSSTEITMSKMKGKFAFAAAAAALTSSPAKAVAKPDAIAFSGSVQLPGGLDISKDQELWIGIGNIVDRITLGPKGKPKYPSDKGYLKKVQFKVSKLTGTVTAGDEQAKLSILISGTGLAESGFDTEGVSAEVSGADKVPVERSIQLGMVLAGVAYQSSAQALFKTKLDRTTQRPVSGDLSGMSRTVQ